MYLVHLLNRRLLIPQTQRRKHPLRFRRLRLRFLSRALLAPAPLARLTCRTVFHGLFPGIGQSQKSRENYLLEQSRSIGRRTMILTRTYSSLMMGRNPLSEECAFKP